MPSDKIAGMTFHVSGTTVLSEFSNDLHTFNLLMALDGARSVGTIAREDQYDIQALSQQVEDLWHQGFIEPMGDSQKTVSERFFTTLNFQLNQAIGPVAEIVIEDEIRKLGYVKGHFPQSMVVELIGVLSKLVESRTKAVKFREQMLDLASQP